MSRVWERPSLLKVGSDPDDKNALATLRDPVIRRIEQSKCDFVVKIVFRTFGVKSFEAAKMLNPILAGSHSNVGKRQLKNDVTKIFCEGLANQTFHIFEYESFRANFTHRPDCFGKKVPVIRRTAVLPTDRERLTRGASGDYLDRPVPFPEIDRVDVGFHERPIQNRCETASLIGANRVAGVGIQFHDSLVLEAQFAGSQGQAARSGK
jgi:hypothetical protein